MATITFCGESFTVDHAVKGADYVHGYDAEGNLVISLDGVTDFSGIAYDGTYMTPSGCLAEICNDVKYCEGALKKRDGTVLTASDFGAAPVGYGLGKLTTYDVYSDAEIDAVLVDIINGMGDHVFKRITLSFKSTTNFTNAGGHYYTDIYKLSTNYAMITIKSYMAGGRELHRVWYAGVLEPWEWVNPPMVAGVEYRTTERHDGKPVYRKLVVYTHSGQLGDSATNTDYTIPHGISDWAKSVRCVTSINNDVTGFYLGSTGGILCVYGFGATNINVRAYKTYFNSPIFRFDLAYIKE